MHRGALIIVFTLSNGKLVSALYRIQVQDFFCVRHRWKNPLKMENEAPRHVKREPSSFTGLSLKLTVRLPCLRMFLVFIRVQDRREEREKKAKEQRAGIDVLFLLMEEKRSRSTE